MPLWRSTDVTGRCVILLNFSVSLCVLNISLQVYQDAASTSEMEEKENCLIQSTSAAVAGPSTIGQVAATTTTNTAAGPAPTSPVPVKAGKLGMYLIYK